MYSIAYLKHLAFHRRLRFQEICHRWNLQNFNLQKFSIRSYKCTRQRFYNSSYSFQDVCIWLVSNLRLKNYITSNNTKSRSPLEKKNLADFVPTFLIKYSNIHFFKHRIGSIRLGVGLLVLFVDSHCIVTQTYNGLIFFLKMIAL